MIKSLLKDKKGIFYLLVSSIFVMVMIIVFLMYKEYSYTDRQKVTETRITTINEFIRSMDADSKRVIYISGFRALIAMEDYVAKSGQYFHNKSDLEEHFRIAFYNGTVNGTKVDVLENSTYSDYLDRLRDIAGTIGIDINISVPNITGISLYQDSHWQIVVNVNVHIDLADRNLSCNSSQCLARWSFNKTYSANVSILDLRDPIYVNATQGRVPNTIRLVPEVLKPFVSGTDITNLILLSNNSYYLENPLAPDFLMRLEGNFSNSTCCGIESLVHIPDLIAQGVSYNSSRSIIDYILFSPYNVSMYRNQACHIENSVANLSDWFRIDISHAYYNISDPSDPKNNDYYYINRTLNYTLCVG